MLHLKDTVHLDVKHSTQRLSHLLPTMKLLTLSLLLCAVLSLASAHCFFMHVEPDATHCLDSADGSWHAVGSSWISNCMNCTCFSCCSTYSIPQIFPEDCESVFNTTACEYVVRRKDDSSVLCPVTAAVGK
uniref:Beta-microseminoprotein-like n=1 Tax=Oryzias latipes TaxID=8090 RepID=A0A3P9IIM6_ORYLA